MDKKKELIHWERVGYVLAGIAALLAIWRVGVAFELTKSDWASWVQAVGSIAAIIGAVLITEYQHRKAIKAADEERALDSLRQLNALNLLVNAAFIMITRANSAFHSGNRGMFDNYFITDYGFGDLEDIASSLSQFEYPALAGDITGLLFLKRILVRLDGYLEHFAKGRFTDAEYRAMVERLEKDEVFVRNTLAAIREAMLREGRRVSDKSRVARIMNVDSHPSTK